MILCSVANFGLNAQQDINRYLILANEQSQQSNFDSSFYYYDKAQQLASESNNQIQIAYINKLIGTEFIYMGQLDTALTHLNNSIKLADKLKIDTLIANNYINIGYIMFLQGKTDSAEVLFDRSLKIYSSIPDSVGIAKAYNLLTILYKSTGDFEKAIEAALISSYLYKKFNKTQEYIRSLINLGNIYEKLGEYDTAFSCYETLHRLSLKHNKPNQALTALINMAVIDYNLGVEASSRDDLEMANIKYQRAKEGYQKAIDISREKNDIQTLALCYTNMSKLYVKIEEFDEAIIASKDAIKLSKEIGDINILIYAYKNLGICYNQIGDYHNAESALNQSLTLAQNARQKEEQEEILIGLSNVYENLGNYKYALEYQRKASVMRDSVMNEAKQSEIEKHKTNFEILHLKDQNEIKELDKKRMHAERNTTLGIGIFVVVTLLGLLIFLRMRVRKNRVITAQKIQKLEDEKKLMAARSVLVGQEKERERIAQELHDGIGVLLSTASIHFSSAEAKADAKTSDMLKKANKLLKDAGKEVRQISHNMMPGVLSKFGLKEAIEDIFEDIEEAGDIDINLQLTCGGVRLAENMEIMLFRVIQEMLNNTLKHAKASKISLLISKDDNELFVDYTDNGIGFDESKLPQEKSLGLSGIRSRIDYLGGTIELSSAPDKGTKYAIMIPVSEKIA